ncbi:hypothetical protein JI749_08860 [Devosia oryziradicis]|uniref:Uncharacterized protein n=1 Tax=Devosia oryziradicis TaxID=2801335 RepID=A0ABX7BRF2_9HYPH|nr:hypothetical protein [Devosia oryziradicis]QQR34508.1 hypothetical protein JI749_08860 [Devosia oryziradicis]
MNIDRRITNGLAWAGVLLVVGVPTADLLSAQFMGKPAAPAPEQIAIVRPVAPVPAPLSQRPAAPVAEQVAAVAPAKPVAEPAKPAVASTKPVVAPATQTADAVDAFLQSGRQLPSYITGADVPASPAAPTTVAATTPTRPVISTTPAPVTQPPAVDPIEVASIAPQKVAPTPMPLSMRPKPVPVALVRDPVVIPPALTPAPSTGAVRPPANVTSADLQDWETGPLSDFLAQRQAGQAVDADGFFLDEAPQRPRRDRIIAREVEPFFFFGD